MFKFPRFHVFAFSQFSRFHALTFSRHPDFILCHLHELKLGFKDFTFSRFPTCSFHVVHVSFYTHDIISRLHSFRFLIVRLYKKQKTIPDAKATYVACTVFPFSRFHVFTVSRFHIFTFSRFQASTTSGIHSVLIHNHRFLYIQII